ncbi:MAG: hypothetical protein ACI8XO_004052, partial [Verrucomicrobiales bacterium]
MLKRSTELHSVDCINNTNNVLAPHIPSFFP